MPEEAKQETTLEEESTVEEAEEESFNATMKKSSKKAKKAKAESEPEPKKDPAPTYEQEVRQTITYRNDYMAKKPSQARMVVAFDCLLWKAGIIGKPDLAREPLPIDIEKADFPLQPGKGATPSKGMQLVLKANELIRAYKTDLTNFVLAIVTIDRESLFNGTAFEEAMKRLNEEDSEIRLNPSEYQEAELPNLVSMEMTIEGMLSNEPAQSLHAYDLIPLVEKNQSLADAYAQKEWTIEELFLEGAEILTKDRSRKTLAFTSEEVDKVLVDLIINNSPAKEKPRQAVTMNPPAMPQEKKQVEKHDKKPAKPPVELSAEEREKAKKKALEALEAEELEKLKKKQARQEAQKKKRFEEAEKKRKESGQMSLFDFDMMEGEDDE